MRERFTTELKEAMKAGDKRKLGTVRLIQAALKDKDIELAAIRTQADIAGSQASVVGEALKHAKIEIIGGETEFFDQDDL